MELSKKHQIIAAGHLLAFYHSDLTFINEFKKFKSGHIAIENYLTREKGTFQSFLNEFRVARNSDINKRIEMLHLVKEWILTGSADDVDKFALHLKKMKCTHKFLATSMASKILFLNNPAIILPSDTNVKKALGVKGKSYQEYAIAVENYKEKYETDINKVVQIYENQLTQIESMFPEFSNIDQVRINRYVDKLLWVKGME